MSLSIEGSERPVELVVTSRKAVIGEIDLWDRHLHIAYIGERCRYRYTREILDLMILLYTYSPTITGKPISGNPLIGGSLRMWR